MRKSSAAKANLLFSTANLVYVVITGIFMVPFYFKHFSEDTYGRWLATIGVIGVIAIAESGIATIVTQKMAVAYRQEDNQRFADICLAGVVLSFAVAFLAAIVGCVLSIVMPGWFGAHSDADQLRFAGLVYSIGSGLMLFQYTLGAIPQAIQRTVIGGCVQLAGYTLNILVVLYALGKGYGVAALALGYFSLGLIMVSGLGLYILYVWKVQGFPRPKANRLHYLEVFHDAKHLLLARVGVALGGNVESSVVAGVDSARSATLLSFTGRLSSVMSMLDARIGSAVFGGLSHVAGSNDDAERKRVWLDVAMIITVFAGISAGISIAFSGALVGVWLKPEQYGGHGLMFLIVAAAFFTNRKVNLGTFLQAEGEFKVSSTWLIWESILRVILMFVLVRLFSLAGIAIATLVTSFVVTWVFTKLLLQKLKMSFWEFTKNGASGFAAALVTGIAWLMLAPTATSWRILFVQGVILSCIMLGMTFLSDPSWFKLFKRVLARRRG